MIYADPGSGIVTWQMLLALLIVATFHFAKLHAANHHRRAFGMPAARLGNTTGHSAVRAYEPRNLC